MEGRGFLEAVHVNSVLGTVIRGISDRLSGKSVADKAGWQRKAADAASAVAFEMLATLTPNTQAVTTGAGGSTPPHDKIAEVGPNPPQTADTSAFIEMPSTCNEGAFFQEGEVLARVGVPGVDEVQFSFMEPPNSYVRIVPTQALKQPLTTAHLNAVADSAPLFPGGPHRPGPAPLLWATQLFSNGELWLAQQQNDRS